jgi:hypothetical protein
LLGLSARHEQALADLFGGVLKLSDRVGLAGSGVVSIDGTRIAGNASPEVNRTFEQIAQEILAEAKAADEAEDELYGDERGDELPEQLRTPEGRREFFGHVKRERQREEDPELTDADPGPAEEVSLELHAENVVGRGRQGRDA